MIQEHVRAEIDFRDIGDRCPRTAADRQKIAARKQQQAEGPRQCGAPAQGFAIEKPHHTAVGPDHQRDIGGGQKRLPHAEPEIDARHGLLRISKVDQDRRIEPESPMPVQFDVHGEDRGRQDSDQHEVNVQHAPPYPFGKPHPERRERQQQRQGGNISRDGAVERQAVPHHAEPLPRGSLRRIRGIVGQKNGFLHRHQQDGRAEHPENKSQFLLYHTSKIMHIYAGSDTAPQPGRTSRRILQPQSPVLRRFRRREIRSGTVRSGKSSCGKVLRSKNPVRKSVLPGATIRRNRPNREPFIRKSVPAADHPSKKRPARKTACRALPKSSRRRPDRRHRRCPERCTNVKSAPHRRPRPRSSWPDAACSYSRSRCPARWR